MATKESVREQFGANATSYVTSAVHAKGASLERLVALVEPQRSWRALDLATAAGHTAFAFAPFVSQVVGADLTPEMLPLARKLALERDLLNVFFTVADVDDLPFSDGAVDLVTCRIAPHHFPDIGRFLSEAARVLRAGGLLGLVDNVVPGARLRGKKAALVREAGEYVNAFEKLRDPSHNRCLSLDEWTAGFASAGLSVEHQETLDKKMSFETWAARHTPERRQQLKALLLQAPAAAAEFLRPKVEGDLTSFHLQEGLFITRKA